MDERAKTLLVSIVVLIVILAIIFGVIFSIVRVIQNRRTTTLSQSPSPKATQRSASPVATSGETGRDFQPSAETDSKFKTYKGTSVEFKYPNSWGLLTCKNSQNIELDPTNSQDQLNFNCDVALKPVTVIVGSSTCAQGETVDKGGVMANKVVTKTQTGTNYKWCTKTTPALEITHRVSSDKSRATSTEDFSAQVEELISTIRTTQQS